MFKNPFSFYGRIRRTEFALTPIFYLIIYFFVLIFENNNSARSWIEITLFLPIYLLISQCAKRCHDLGKAGCWQFVPFYAFPMFFKAGDFGSNGYGDNPKVEGNEAYDVSGYDFKTGKMIETDENGLSQALQEIKPDKTDTISILNH
jgi:uncharacterized membrane protein YhaH (DUF805 family)